MENENKTQESQFRDQLKMESYMDYTLSKNYKNSHESRQRFINDKGEEIFTSKEEFENVGIIKDTYSINLKGHTNQSKPSMQSREISLREEDRNISFITFNEINNLGYLSNPNPIQFHNQFQGSLPYVNISEKNEIQHGKSQILGKMQEKYFSEKIPENFLERPIQPTVLKNQFSRAIQKFEKVDTLPRDPQKDEPKILIDKSQIIENEQPTLNKQKSPANYQDQPSEKKSFSASFSSDDSHISKSSKNISQTININETKDYLLNKDSSNNKNQGFFQVISKQITKVTNKNNPSSRNSIPEVPNLSNQLITSIFRKPSTGVQLPGGNHHNFGSHHHENLKNTTFNKSNFFDHDNTIDIKQEGNLNMNQFKKEKTFNSPTRQSTNKNSLFRKKEVPQEKDLIEDDTLYADKSLYLFSRNNKFRLFLFSITEHYYFDIFIIFTIILNSIILSLGMSLDLRTNKFDILDAAEYLFVIIYTLECLMKVISLGFSSGKKSYIIDHWNKLDFLVVIIGLIDFIPDLVKFEGFKIFRTFRPLRSISLLPGLKSLVQTLVISIKQFFHLFLLLIFFFVLYGILGVAIWSGLFSYRCRGSQHPINGSWPVIDNSTMLCGGYYKCPVNKTCGSLTEAFDTQKYFLPMENLYEEQDIYDLYYGITTFDNIGSAFLTIFQCATLEGWSNIMYMIQSGQNYYSAAIYFLSLVVILNYFVINFTVAIMMEGCRSSQMDHDPIDDLKVKTLSSGKTDSIQLNIAKKLKKLKKFFKKSKFIKRVEPYLDIHRKNKFSYWAYVIINQPLFDFLIYFFIMVNICTLASTNDLDFYPKQGSSSDISKNNINPDDGVLSPAETINYILVVLFTLESVLRFVALGLKNFFKNKNNIFDLIIVLISLFEIIFLKKSTMAILRVLRMYRLLNLLNKWKTIAIIMKCITTTVKEMGYYVLLQFIMVYVFALIGMSFFKDTLKFDPVSNKYSETGSPPKVNFDNLYESMIAVFVLVIGDNWFEILHYCIRSPKTNKGVVYFYFITVIILLNIIMMNLVIAFLVYIFEKSRKRYQFQERNKKINLYFKKRKIKTSLSFSYLPQLNLRNMIPKLEQEDYDAVDDLVKNEKKLVTRVPLWEDEYLNTFKNAPLGVKTKNSSSKNIKKSTFRRMSSQINFESIFNAEKEVRDLNTDKIIKVERKNTNKNFNELILKNEFKVSNEISALNHKLYKSNLPYVKNNFLQRTNTNHENNTSNYFSMPMPLKKLQKTKTINFMPNKTVFENLKKINVQVEEDEDTPKITKKIYAEEINREELLKHLKIKKFNTKSSKIKDGIEIDLHRKSKISEDKESVEVDYEDEKKDQTITNLQNLQDLEINYTMKKSEVENQINQKNEIQDFSNLEFFRNKKKSVTSVSNGAKVEPPSPQNTEIINDINIHNYKTDNLPQQIFPQTQVIENIFLSEQIIRERSLTNQNKPSKFNNEKFNYKLNINSIFSLGNSNLTSGKKINKVDQPDYKENNLNISKNNKLLELPLGLSKQNSSNLNSRRGDTINSINNVNSVVPSARNRGISKKSTKKISDKITSLTSKIRESAKLNNFLEPSNVKEIKSGKIKKSKTIIATLKEKPQDKQNHLSSFFKYISESSLFIFHRDLKIRKNLVFFVNSKFCEFFMVIIILLSNISLLIDNPYLDPDSVFSKVLNTFDDIFTFVFFIEMVLKILAFGLFWDQFSKIEDSFNFKDTEHKIEVKLESYIAEFEYFKRQKAGLKNIQLMVSASNNNTLSQSPQKNYNKKKSMVTDKDDKDHTVLELPGGMNSKKNSFTITKNLMRAATPNSTKYDPNLQDKNLDGITGPAENKKSLNECDCNSNSLEVPADYWKRAYLREVFNILDFIVNIISMINFFSSTSLNSDNSKISSSTLQNIKTLRTLRALRPLRNINKFTELKLVVKCLIDSVPAILNMGMIGSFVFFIYAIIGLNLFHGVLGTCNDPTALNSVDCFKKNSTWTPSPINFDNIGFSFMTVYELATTSGWYDVMYNTVKNTSVWSGIYFISFMLIGSIFIMNLSVTVIVDNFITLNEAEEGVSMITEEQKEWVKAMKYFLKYKPVPSLKTRNFSKFRLLCYKIISHKYFNSVINIIILLNVLTMCFIYDRNPIWMDNLQNILFFLFSILYTLELIMKLIVYRRLFFIDVWNKFDFIVVLTSNLSIIMTLIRSSIQNDSEISIGRFNIYDVILKTIRILRVFRLINLNNHVKNYFYTLLFLFPSLINIGSLLLIILMVYAVFGINMFGTVKYGSVINEDNNFQDILSAFIFLIRTTTGDNWNDSMHELAMNQPGCTDIQQTYQDLIENGPQGCGSSFAYFYFISFMLINSMVIMNLFIAVVVDSFMTNTERHEAIEEDDIKRFFELWGKYDREVHYTIEIYDFVLLMMELPKPLGIKGDLFFSEELNQEKLHGNIYISYNYEYFADDKQCIRILTKLKIESKNDKIHIIDAIKLITKRAVILDKEGSWDSPSEVEEYQEKFEELDQIAHERFKRKLNEKFKMYHSAYKSNGVEKTMSNYVVAQKVIGKFLKRWRARRNKRLQQQENIKY
jgi:hypothetical protein